MRYVFDIDGTICTQEIDYKKAKPRDSIIESIVDLKAQGHEITIFTARGSGTGTDWRDVTEAQLQEWGVPYDKLIFGKPPADLYIDDRAINVADWEKSIHA